MARYYYTDALKAAYMQREFGFKFLYAPNGNEKDVCALIAAGCFTWMENISYLYPDCHEMLKPQVGDLVYNGDIYFIWENIEISNDYIEYHFFGNKEDSLSGKSKIIQRNNKAFFTPEVEGD